MEHLSLLAALGLVLLLEGLMPLLMPKRWQAWLAAISQLPVNRLRRMGGALVTAGVVLLWLVIHH